MWPQSIVTQMLNIRLPIIQAPMAGGITSAALVASVSQTGGLGSLGGAYLSPQTLRKTIQEIKQQTNAPFAVNLFIPQTFEENKAHTQEMIKIIEARCQELDFHLDASSSYTDRFDEQLEIVIEENVPVLSFIFGCLKKDHILRCKQKGIILIGTATSLEEALILEEAEIDMIVAQGREAGGHQGHFQYHKPQLLSLASLLSSLVPKLKTPVIAAGGIMNAQDIVTMINQGAQGVQMGTAFICCPESIAESKYKEILLNTKQDLTVLTRVFSGRLARGIRNTFIDRMADVEDKILPFPLQNTLTSPMRQKAKQLGNTDFMSLWAGQRAFLCQALPAKELIATIDNEVRLLLDKS